MKEKRTWDLSGRRPEFIYHELSLSEARYELPEKCIQRRRGGSRRKRKEIKGRFRRAALHFVSTLENTRQKWRPNHVSNKILPCEFPGQGNANHWSYIIYARIPKDRRQGVKMDQLTPTFHKIATRREEECEERFAMSLLEK